MCICIKKMILYQVLLSLGLATQPPRPVREDGSVLGTVSVGTTPPRLAHAFSSVPSAPTSQSLCSWEDGGKPEASGDEETLAVFMSRHSVLLTCSFLLPWADPCLLLALHPPSLRMW